MARQPEGRENLWIEMEIAGGIGPGTRATLSCGNIGPRSTVFFAKLDRGDVIYSELNGKASLAVNGEIILRDDTHDPLARMIERFLWDVAVKNVDDFYYHVRLSRTIASVLTEARDRAE